jgi:hypothetical protein
VIRKFLYTITLLLLSSTIFAQDLHLVERDLITLFQNAEYYHTSSRDTDRKGITVEDSIFQARLLQITNTIPGTLTYPFDSIKIINLWLPSGGILNSDDSLVRIYCQRFHDYFQYKSANGVKCIMLPAEPGTYDLRRGYRNLYSFNYKNKNYYLGIYLFADGEGVKILSINPKGTVDTLPLFKTEKGMKNKILYHAKNCKDNPDGYIYFDRTNLTLYVPVTNDSGLLTSKPQAYKFTGKYFEKSAT